MPRLYPRCLQLQIGRSLVVKHPVIAVRPEPAERQQLMHPSNRLRAPSAETCHQSIKMPLALTPPSSRVFRPKTASSSSVDRKPVHNPSYPACPPMYSPRFGATILSMATPHQETTGWSWSSSIHPFRHRCRLHLNELHHPRYFAETHKATE